MVEEIIHEETKKITKKEVDALIAIPGNVRGAIILADAKYIRLKGGEETIEEIERRLKELGHPFLLKDVKPMEYYPEALSVLIILLAREILNLTDNDIFEMGQSAPKLSLFTSILIKYFVSIKKVFEESPKYWRASFDFGRIEPVEINEDKKYAIVRVIGYKFHPIMCIYHKGYFLQVAQFALGNKSATIEETKCVFRGDPYHEYIIRWQ